MVGRVAAQKLMQLSFSTTQLTSSCNTNNRVVNYLCNLLLCFHLIMFMSSQRSADNLALEAYTLHVTQPGNAAYRPSILCKHSYWPVLHSLPQFHLNKNTQHCNLTLNRKDTAHERCSIILISSFFSTPAWGKQHFQGTVKLADPAQFGGDPVIHTNPTQY